MKIDELTAVQKLRLTEYKEEWLRIGLSTKRSDRPKAEQAVRDVYKVAGLKEPEIFIWLDSPQAGAIAAHLLSTGIKKPFGDQVGAQVRDQVWAQVRDQVRDQVGTQVRDQVWAQVRAQVRAQVGTQVRAQVGTQVWAQVRDQVRDQVWDQVYKCAYGAQDSDYLSFYAFFLEVVGLECCARLKPAMELAKNCGWWWPFEGAVILTERPTEIHMENGRLHKDLAPSISYADGFNVYSLYGVRVPEWLVLTSSENLDVTKVIGLENVEHRLIGIRKLSPERMLKALDAKSISTKDNEYELFEVTLEGSKEKLLKMKNPSEDKTHYEWVEPYIKTCTEALAWRRGLTLFKEPVFKT